MNMVGHRRPGVNWCFSFYKDSTESFDKLIAILIIFEDFAFFDPSNDDVMKGTGSIYSGFTGMMVSISDFSAVIK